MWLRKLIYWAQGCSLLKFFFWLGHFSQGGGGSLLTARRYWIRATLERDLSGNTSYHNWHFTRRRSNSASHLTCHETSLTPSSMSQMNTTYKSRIHRAVNEAVASLLIWELRFCQVGCLPGLTYLLVICCWSYQLNWKSLVATNICHIVMYS